MLEFWNMDNSSSKSILDVLETIYLIFRKTIVQIVTVVKLGVYAGGSNCSGGANVKVGMAGYSEEHECDDLVIEEIISENK